MSRELAGYLWCVFAILWCALRLPHVRRSRSEPIRATERDLRDWMARAAAYVGLGIIPGISVAASFLDFADVPFVPAVAWAGVLLFATSLWLLHRTHRDLGRRFSDSLEIRSEHTLMTAGIYRHVRHPMYAAFWLWALAQALLLANWIVALAGLAGMAYLFAARVGREERLMLREFGDQYRAYMDRTARLLPGLY